MKFLNYDCYKKLLLCMKEINNIYSFKDIEKHNKTGFILRHDVDFDLEKAYIISNIEREENITSTFFILVTSELYNVNSCVNRNIVRNMVSNGFEIGLHFDPTVYGTGDLCELGKKIKNECCIIENITGCPVETVSLHNPSIHNQYPIFDGYKNAYSREFFNPDLYLSDSCKDFRGKNVFEFIEKGKNNLLQVLFHPIHFSEKEETYIESFNKIIEAKTNSFDKYVRCNKTYIKEIKEESLLNCFIDYVKEKFDNE